MGRYWYEEEGKYLNKRNTFSDFIACAEYLVENNFTKPELLACEGKIALMSAITYNNVRRAFCRRPPDGECREHAA